MQELEKRYEIARLIACELIGVLSGREAEDLEVWKNSSEKHAREYMEIRERLLRDIDYPDYLELKQEWEGFGQKLEKAGIQLVGNSSSCLCGYLFGYNIFMDERACCRTGGCRNIRGDERF